MWQLKTDNKTKREYVNSTTGGKCQTEMVYVDREGNKWYEFTDLLSMPYTRKFAATKISSLYALGLSKDDLTGHINGLKALLKSDDQEKYEKCYSNLLNFEAKANQATDAIKQMSSLVCVYYLMNDEAIDGFDGNLQVKKMSILEADIEAHSFFLKRQMQATESYTQR